MAHEEHLENLLEALQTLLREDQDAAVALLTARHAADQADIVEQLDDEDQQVVAELLSEEQIGDILEHLSEESRRRLLREWTPQDLAPVLNEVDEDIAADIVQDLDLEPHEERAVVALLEDSESVSELLTYGEDTAGGRMSTDVVALRRTWTVEEAINFLRNESPDQNHPFYLYVVDEDGRLRGIVSLRALVTSSPNTPIAAITDDTVLTLNVQDDQEVAAERMRHYNLMALPVVDRYGVLAGVITADDVLDVQVQEATEDMYKMAGVGVKEWAFSPVWESAGRRIPWLGFNMIWAFAGAVIISLFEGTLSKVAALAIFMPMIAGQAGNAGIQTATIMVRSMALGEVESRDALRILRKEWALGLIKGVLFGVVLGVVAFVWRGHFMFGVIAGGAMFLNMIVASTTGVIIPITLRRFGIDPATIAGVFDTMITDLMGFLIYLGLATLFISQIT